MLDVAASKLAQSNHGTRRLRHPAVILSIASEACSPRVGAARTSVVVVNILIADETAERRLTREAG
jgi:hypothetical protein